MNHNSTCSKKGLPYILGIAITGVLVFNGIAAYADPTPEESPAPPELVAASTSPSDSPSAGATIADDSHISLSLRDAPVTSMLSLVSSMTTVNFRYATPPDARITATFNDAPLVPTLVSWLNATGFNLHRAGSEFFIVRDAARAPFLAGITTAPGAKSSRAPATADSGATAAGWSYWSQPSPPPAGWIMPAASGSVAVGFGTQTRSEAGWRPATQGITPEMHPGVSVTLPPQNSDAGALYLRCQIPLKFVPRGAQLVLETPNEAALYVNGALVLRRWKGRRVLDLSQMLTAGHNCLAIEWSPAARAKNPATANAPLRYEWFFADDRD